jgi:hypothetical protein
MTNTLNERSKALIDELEHQAARFEPDSYAAFIVRQAAARIAALEEERQKRIELAVRLRVTSPDWIEDCIKWYGEVLAGRYAHWCPDWDGLPIDETSPEFKSCTCNKEHL